jgi:hypothetical protein
MRKVFAPFGNHHSCTSFNSLVALSTRASSKRAVSLESFHLKSNETATGESSRPRGETPQSDPESANKHLIENAVWKPLAIARSHPNAPAASSPCTTIYQCANDMTNNR